MLRALVGTAAGACAFTVNLSHLRVKPRKRLIRQTQTLLLVSEAIREGDQYTLCMING